MNASFMLSNREREKNNKICEAEIILIIQKTIYE